MPKSAVSSAGLGIRAVHNFSPILNLFALKENKLYARLLPGISVHKKSASTETDCGGPYWTRTNDPRDVNTVLYHSVHIDNRQIRVRISIFTLLL